MSGVSDGFERKEVLNGSTHGPSLPAGGEGIGKRAGEDEHSDDGRENETSRCPEGIAEDEEVRVAGCIVERALQICQAEDKGNEEDHAEEAVEEVGGKHGSRHCLAGVFDLFRLWRGKSSVFCWSRGGATYHVSSRIRADTSIDSRDLADHERQAHRAPSAIVCELEEHDMCRISGCEHEYHDNNL